MLAARHRSNPLQIQSQRPADIAQCQPRPITDHHPGQGRTVSAVFAINVLDDLFAALVLKIDIDIRRLVALGRYKTLEQQTHALRIDLGDAQAIAHRRIGSAAPALA